MLVILITLALLALLLESLSLRNPLSTIHYNIRIDRRTVEPGEIFHLETVLTQEGKRPVNFLRLRERVPGTLQLTGNAGKSVIKSGGGDRAELRSSYYLMPRQRLIRNLEVSLPKRGRYIFTGAELTGGDFLGLSSQSREDSLYREIVVLPEKRECPSVDGALGGFLGDASVRRFIMEDPVLSIGFSPYLGHEPMKAISWSRSAIQNDLMVKNMDHTLEPKTGVFLCLSSQDSAEAMFSLARAVCEALEKKKVKYAFSSNARAVGAVSAWVSAEEGLGSSHLMSILELLGRALSKPGCGVQKYLLRTYKRTEQGQSCLFLLPEDTGEYMPLLHRIRVRSGCPLLIVTPTGVRRVV